MTTTGGEPTQGMFFEWFLCAFWILQSSYPKFGETPHPLCANPPLLLVSRCGTPCSFRVTQNSFLVSTLVQCKAGKSIPPIWTCRFWTIILMPMRLNTTKTTIIERVPRLPSKRRVRRQGRRRPTSQAMNAVVVLRLTENVPYDRPSHERLPVPQQQQVLLLLLLRCRMFDVTTIGTIFWTVPWGKVGIQI